MTDPAGLSFALLAFWLAVRSWRLPQTLVPAAIAFGFACGVRPQTAAIALVPLVVSFVKQEGRLRWIGSGALAASVFGFAILPIIIAAHGLGPLIAPLKGQWNYVFGFTSPLARPVGVHFLTNRWLVAPWVSNRLAFVIAAAVILGLAILISTKRGRRVALFLTASFGPYFVCAWLFLDATFSGRYILPALVPVAVVVSVGVVFLEKRFVPRAFPILAILITVAMVLETEPAIAVLHRRLSPPVEAAEKIRASMGDRPFAITYPADLYVPAALLFPRNPKFEWNEGGTIPASIPRDLPVERFGIFDSGDQNKIARWPPLKPFFSLGRGRYLVVPYGLWNTEAPRFRNGWYGEETETRPDGLLVTFRWMAAEGEVVLPRSKVERKLTLDLLVPIGDLPSAPEIEILLNGNLIDRFTMTAERGLKDWKLPPSPSDGSRDLLVLRTSQTFVPATRGASGDHRTLGLRVFQLSVTTRNMT